MRDVIGGGGGGERTADGRTGGRAGKRGDDVCRHRPAGGGDGARESAHRAVIEVSRQPEHRRKEERLRRLRAREHEREEEHRKGVYKVEYRAFIDGAQLLREQAGERIDRGQTAVHAQGDGDEKFELHGGQRAVYPVEKERNIFHSEQNYIRPDMQTGGYIVELTTF